MAGACEPLVSHRKASRWRPIAPAPDEPANVAGDWQSRPLPGPSRSGEERKAKSEEQRAESAANKWARPIRVDSLALFPAGPPASRAPVSVFSLRLCARARGWQCEFIISATIARPAGLPKLLFTPNNQS